jgi:hypothetical protein
MINDNKPDWIKLAVVAKPGNSSQMASKEVAAAMLKSLNDLLPNRDVKDSPDALNPRNPLEPFENTRPRHIRDMAAVTAMTVGGSAFFAFSNLVSSAGQWSAVASAAIAVGGVWVWARSNKQLQAEFKGSVIETYNKAMSATNMANALAWTASLYHMVEAWNPLMLWKDRTDILLDNHASTLKKSKDDILSAGKYAYEKLEEKKRSGRGADDIAEPLKDGLFDQRLKPALAGIEASYNRAGALPDFFGSVVKINMALHLVYSLWMA